MKTAWLLTIALAGALALPLLAHHSFNAEYDESKPVSVTGVVTKVEWQNPHVWFYVDEKAADGSIVHWAFSGGAPGQLMRRGVTHDVIKVGMTVVVKGSRAKDGSNNAYGSSVTFPDGRQVFTSGNEVADQGNKK
jgi:hypothetical protein